MGGKTRDVTVPCLAVSRQRSGNGFGQKQLVKEFLNDLSSAIRLNQSHQKVGKGPYNLSVYWWPVSIPPLGRAHKRTNVWSGTAYL